MSPNPAAVTMALLSGSLTWSGTSKMRHMNPEWRSLMRKKCPISPLISPWKTRSIEMGSTGMTSKWTEFALMYSNWNKFLENSFFLFYSPSIWTSRLVLWTLNLNLSSPRGSFWQKKKVTLILVFHLLCLCHWLLQNPGDVCEESCFQQPCVGSVCPAGSPGSRNYFIFLSPHWHLLGLGSH